MTTSSGAGLLGSAGAANHSVADKNSTHDCIAFILPTIEVGRNHVLRFQFVDRQLRAWDSHPEAYA
jgi:hypothetical protein